LWAAVHRRKAEHAAGQPITPAPWEDHAEHVPPEAWVWRGCAGHFIAVSSCCFRLHTTVGDYRVSTVGCYHPAGSDPTVPHEIGSGRLYETMVFRNGADGEPLDWTELDSDAYNDEQAAEAGHLAMCWKWAATRREDER
jgi:hypothetical protein